MKFSWIILGIVLLLAAGCAQQPPVNAAACEVTSSDGSLQSKTCTVQKDSRATASCETNQENQLFSITSAGVETLVAECPTLKSGKTIPAGSYKITAKGTTPIAWTKIVPVNSNGNGDNGNDNGTVGTQGTCPVIKDGKIGQTYTCHKKLTNDDYLEFKITLVKKETGQTSLLQTAAQDAPGMPANISEYMSIDTSFYQFKLENTSNISEKYWQDTKDRHSYSDAAYSAVEFGLKGGRPNVNANDGPILLATTYLTEAYSPNMTVEKKDEYRTRLYPLTDEWPVTQGNTSTFWVGYQTECNKKDTFISCPVTEIEYLQGFFEGEFSVTYQNP